MKKTSPFEFQFLKELLSPSLFSEFPLMEGFNDKKALFVIDTCKQHIGQTKWWEDDISTMMRDRLIEAVARNVGSSENYGFGFPNDLLDNINTKLEFEINERLIQDILYWGNGMSEYSMVTISNDKNELYFFQSNKETRELISYSTMASLTYNVLKLSLYYEYERLKNFILTKIPFEAWKSILNEGESIEKYL